MEYLSILRSATCLYLALPNSKLQHHSVTVSDWCNAADHTRINAQILAVICASHKIFRRQVLNSFQFISGKMNDGALCKVRRIMWCHTALYCRRVIGCGQCSQRILLTRVL